MARIIVTPATQSEATIQSLLARRAIETMVVETFHVTDFMDTWLQVSRDPAGENPYDGVASPGLTKALSALNVKAGDTVLVARRPHVVHEHNLRMISPLTDENRHLIGKHYYVSQAGSAQLL